MVTPSDLPGWLSALRLPTHVTLGLFLAGTILLIFDHYGVITLSQFGLLAKPAVILLTIIFGSVAVTGMLASIIDFARDMCRARRLRLHQDAREQARQKQLRNRQEIALQRIPHLSMEELWHIVDCLNRDSQTFYTWVHSSGAASLMAKGLVGTPSSTHHRDHYPFVVHDFAWRYILEHKDEIFERYRQFEESKSAASRKRR